MGKQQINVSMITEQNIEDTLRVLLQAGIEPGDCASVLQQIGESLLDMDLYAIIDEVESKIDLENEL